MPFGTVGVFNSSYRPGPYLRVSKFSCPALSQVLILSLRLRRAYWQIDGGLIESEGAQVLRTRSKVRFGDVGTRTVHGRSALGGVDSSQLVSYPANGWAFMTTQHFCAIRRQYCEIICCRAAKRFSSVESQNSAVWRIFLDLRCGGRSTTLARQSGIMNNRYGPSTAFYMSQRRDERYVTGPHHR